MEVPQTQMNIEEMIRDVTGGLYFGDEVWHPQLVYDNGYCSMCGGHGHLKNRFGIVSECPSCRGIGSMSQLSMCSSVCTRIERIFLYADESGLHLMESLGVMCKDGHTFQIENLYRDQESCDAACAVILDEMKGISVDES